MTLPGHDRERERDRYVGSLVSVPRLGTAFGEDRLRDVLAREHAAGATPQEVVRRVIRTAVEHSEGSLRDDATMVYLAWHG